MSTPTRVLALALLCLSPAVGQGIITTVAGSDFVFTGEGKPATQAPIQPLDIAVDGAGNLYIADPGNERVFKVTSGGVLTTLAGNGIAGYSGDGGPATAAALNYPEGVAVDRSGNVYIADRGEQPGSENHPGRDHHHDRRRI